MVSRFVFAGVVALFALGSFAAPASAKGAFGGGHAGFAVHSGLHPHGPLVAPGPFFARVHAHGIGLHRLAFPRDRFGARAPGPVWWGFDAIGPYAYYYPPYEQSGDAAAGQQPAPPPVVEGAPQTKPVVIYRPGCRTQTQTVPSEFTGTRTINITRCY